LDVFPDVDGLFFDGLNTYDCNCKYCMETMLANKINVSCFYTVYYVNIVQVIDPHERWRFYKQVINDFKSEMTALIRAKNRYKGTPFFFFFFGTPFFCGYNSTNQLTPTLVSVRYFTTTGT